jgi:hypothetical protein
VSSCGYDDCDWPVEQTLRFDEPMTLGSRVGDGDFDPPIELQAGDSMLLGQDRIVVCRQGEASEVYCCHPGLRPSQRWRLELDS